MTTERWIFPLECPDCKASSGYPFEAATKKGNTMTVRIALRCRDCRYEWKLDLDTDPVPIQHQEN